MRLPYYLYLLIAAALTLTPALASAKEGEPLDVVVFELEGDGIAPELLETLTAIMRHEARQHHRYSLVNPAALMRHEVALVVGCDPDDPQCLRQIAEFVDGELLIFGEVRKIGGNLEILVDILDTRLETEPVRVERRFPEGDDPVPAFQREVGGLFRSLDSLGETLLIVNAPNPDTAIRLEDITVGHGSLRREGLPPGRYRVALGERGHELWSGEVELKPGQPVMLRPSVDEPTHKHQARASEPVEASVVQVITPGAREESPPRPEENGARRSNLGAFSLIGAGAASLAGSALMVNLMRDVEDKIVSENAAGTMTRLRYDELIGQGRSYEMAHRVLLGAGVGAVGVGLAIAIWNWRQNQTHPGLALTIQQDHDRSTVGIIGRW